MLDVRDESFRHGEPPAGRGWYGFAPRMRGEGTAARRAWRGAYVRRLIAGDAVCAALAALVAYLGRFGAEASTGHASLWAAAALPLVWIGGMLVARSYEQRFLWLGAEEFRRVFFAAALLLATLGTVSWALKLDLARGFVIVAVPLATVLTLVQRYVQRQRIHRGRGHGRYQQTTVLVGHRGAVAALDEQIDREAYHGYKVIGCCLPDGRNAGSMDAF